MRAVFLVAWREFAENAKTKGFWIGLFLFPVIIFASIFVQRALDKATPTRNFVLVDQSGAYADVVQAAIERLHQADVLEALGEYQKKYAKEQTDVPRPDLESMPAIDQAKMKKAMEDGLAKGPGAQLGQLLTSGGLEAVLDQLKPLLVEDAPEFIEPKRRFREVPLPASLSADMSLKELAKGLKGYLKGEDSIEVDGHSEDLFAAVLIPKDVNESVVDPGSLEGLATSMAASAGGSRERSGVQYWATNLADKDLKERVQSSINQELRRTQYLARGMDAEAVAAVEDLSVPFSDLNPAKAEGKEEVSMADVLRQWAPVGFVYLLWVGIFTISQMLLNNTIEEKSNRIIEVLLSSVTPGELMMGKLVGIAGVGLTMIAVWMGSLITILKLNAGPEAEFPTMLWEVLRTSGLIPAFIVYFFLGYLLYSALFLAIGSVCNTLKEAQNLMGPVMLIMMVPIITMMFIPKDPNGTLARILSWIPLYTPFTMMNRAAAHPPMIDTVGTLALLIVFTAFVMWMVGRIFRIGILRTGQPPKIMELLRWVRSS